MTSKNVQILTDDQELDLVNQIGARLDKLLVQAGQRELVNQIYQALILIGNSAIEKKRQAQLESAVREAVTGGAVVTPIHTEDQAAQNGC